jgi:hypothetical protein
MEANYGGDTRYCTCCTVYYIEKYIEDFSDDKEN